MNERKQVLMNTIRCNLHMAKRAKDVHFKKRYIKILKQNMLVYKKLLVEYNATEKTKTIILNKVS